MTPRTQENTLLTYEDMIQKQPNGGDGGFVGLPCSLWVCHPSSNSVRSPTQKLPEPLKISVFLMGGSLLGQDCLIIGH